MAMWKGFPELFEYLKRKEFPDCDKVEALWKHARSRDEVEYRNKRSAQIDAFIRKLFVMPKDALMLLVAPEREPDRQASVEKLFDDEAARFFNLANATANFVHWSKLAHWTLDEATALSFGKAPERVCWENVEPYVDVSLFAMQYSRLRFLAQGTKMTNPDFGPVQPSVFLTWARRTGIEVHAELVRLVERRGFAVDEWIDLYDKLQAQYDVAVANHDRVVKTVEDLVTQRNSLEIALAELQANPLAVQSSGQRGAAEHEHRGQVEPYHRHQGWFNKEADNYPEELDKAMQAWHAVSSSRDDTMTVKEQLSDWIEPRSKQLSAEAIKRISIICNWEKEGGQIGRAHV